MTRTYGSPELEIILFEMEDVITISGDENETEITGLLDGIWVKRDL